MWRVARLALLAVAACGRIGFDTIDTNVFEPVLLLPGGDADGVVVGASPMTVFAWFGGRGVFRSDDAGASWVECARRPATHLAVAPTGRVFLATPDDVFVSDDACASWTPTGLGPANYVRVIGSRTLAGTDAGLRAYDGSTWSVVVTPFEGESVDAISADATQTTILIGSRVGGVARSTDGGVVWAVRDQGLGNQQVVAVAIAPSDPSRAYALEQSGGASTGAVYRSNDGGQTWVTIYGNGGGPNSLAVDPTDADRVLVANYNYMLLTENGGVGFNDSRSASIGLAPGEGFAFDGAGAAYAATGRGVFHATFPGPAWTERDGAIDAWKIRGVATTQDHATLLLATTAGVLRSIDGGATYDLYSAGSVFTASCRDVLVTNNGNVLTAGGRAVRLSTDGGVTYTTAYDVNGQNGYTARALALRGNRAFVATATQIAYADLPWTSWTDVRVAGQARDVLDVAVHGDGAVVAIAEEGVFQSTDNGLTFVALAGGPPSPRIVVGTATPLLVGTVDGLWSHDGVAWARAGLDGLEIVDVLVQDDVWFAATSAGVRRSRDAGVTWTDVPGLETARPYSLGLSADGSLLVGTEGSGLFRAALP